MAFRLRVILLVLTMIWTPAAVAEPAPFPELADALPQAENRTYGDLVRLVVPGIDNGDAAAAGTGVIAVRHISGEDMTSVVPVSVEAPRIAAIPLRSGGKDRIALLINLGESEHEASDFVILALFDVAGGPRLLDAAHVGFNRYTSFHEPSLLSVGVADDLLMTRGTHSNSNQAYATTALILVHDDRLELVDTISTFDDRACAYERLQRLDIRQGEEAPFSDIVATVTEVTAAVVEECGNATAPEPGSRTITVMYRWDAAEKRYRPDTDAFDVLARENEARF
ncbi:MAG: hypothetical protein WA975_21820 [Mesorhizobium sp.]